MKLVKQNGRYEAISSYGEWQAWDGCANDSLPFSSDPGSRDRVPVRRTAGTDHVLNHLPCPR